MGRPKHTLPPVHKTPAARPRWFFRAQVDALVGPGQIERRERPYYLGYCDEQGKRKAEKERDAICATLNNRPEMIQSQTRFGAVLDAFESTYLPALKANTRSNYTSQIEVHIRPEFGEMRLCDINPMRVQAWVNAMSGSGASKATTLAVLRSVFERAADWNYTSARNPTRSVAVGDRMPVQKRRAFTPQEYLKIRARLKPPMDTAADVAAFCGFRVGEIAALTRWSLDYDSGLIVVAANMSAEGEVSTPKNKKRRTAPMGWLRGDLLRICPSTAPPEQSVFGSTYRQLRSAVDWILESTGLGFPGSGWHCFRRMYATNGKRFLEIGDLQAQMGHAYQAMTRHYIDDPSQERIEAAMERMRAEIFFAGDGGRA